jgi:hypothetical protein
MPREALPLEDVTQIETITAVTHPAYAVIGDASYDVGAWGALSVFVTVHALTGTDPTLDVKVQHCPTLAVDYANWSDLIAIPQFTATGSKAVTIPNNSTPVWTFGRYLRVVGQVGGTDTPEFVASVVITPKE